MIQGLTRDPADGPSVLVAVPIFNEAGYFPRVLDKLLARPHDVLFVDDGSTDGTLGLLDEAEDRGQINVVRHGTNKGYGAALIDAFAYAGRYGYDWVVTMDCDEQHDPADIPRFVAEIERGGADIVSGTRYAAHDADQDHAPAERRAVNLIITATVNELFGWKLTDTFCGFKAHRVAPTLGLDLTEPGYAFPLQLWPRAYAAGLRVREIPVKRIYNDDARSFGHDTRAGDLDDAKTRLGHYLEVLRGELCGLDLPRLRDATPAVARDVLADLGDDLIDGGVALAGSLQSAAAVPCP